MEIRGRDLSAAGRLLYKYLAALAALLLHAQVKFSEKLFALKLRELIVSILLGRRRRELVYVYTRRV